MSTHMYQAHLNHLRKITVLPQSGIVHLWKLIGMKPVLDANKEEEEKVGINLLMIMLTQVAIFTTVSDKKKAKIRKDNILHMDVQVIQ
jgi:hypothetical protein